MHQRSPFAAAAATAAVLLLAGCAWPTDDPIKLEAIRAESQILMDAYSSEASVPSNKWPRAIADLEPEFVSIYTDGVHITTKAYFDGGWGYFVPRQVDYVPEPVGRFKRLSHGVYWWHPY
jgi:hypothetical protein